MQKLIPSILFISSLFLLTLNADQKQDKDTIKLPKEFESSEIIITEKECQEYLGKENYKFIAELYDDKMVPLLKCKEEMKK